MTTAKRRDVAMQLSCQLKKVAEKNDAGIDAGVFFSSAYRERGKVRGELYQRNMGRDASDPSAGLGSDVGRAVKLVANHQLGSESPVQVLVGGLLEQV